ncbi:E6 [Gull papillomavirus 1]|uniref:E6 n=1 Tax=Gull papillomavirus 1 TaxID=2562547 RepID=A0AAE6D313_9PAPI|nr:E6 [Gull papillomavirus 1]
MPILCTLGQVLQQARMDLLVICVHCRFCRQRMTAVDILEGELEAREDYCTRARTPFIGYRTLTGFRWFGTCGQCRRFRRYAYYRP